MRVQKTLVLRSSVDRHGKNMRLAVSNKMLYTPQQEAVEPDCPLETAIAGLRQRINDLKKQRDRIISRIRSQEEHCINVVNQLHLPLDTRNDYVLELMKLRTERRSIANMAGDHQAIKKAIKRGIEWKDMKIASVVQQIASTTAYIREDLNNLSVLRASMQDSRSSLASIQNQISRLYRELGDLRHFHEIANRQNGES